MRGGVPSKIKRSCISKLYNFIFMVRLEDELAIQNLFPVENKFTVCMFLVKRNNKRPPISIVIGST